jgi:hypothetical protein
MHLAAALIWAKERLVVSRSDDGELTVSAGDVSVTTGKGYVLTSQPM